MSTSTTTAPQETATTSQTQPETNTSDPNTTKKTVLVFGATGPSGQLTVLELLRLNHSVIIYCRNPKKLHLIILGSNDVKVITGALNSTETLTSTFSNHRIDAVICLIGPTVSTMPWKIGDTYSSFQRTLLELMKTHNVRRLLTMGTISITDPRDKFSFGRAFLRLLIQTVVYPAYREIIRISTLYSAMPTDEIAWTVFRLPLLQGKTPRAQADETVSNAGRIGGRGRDTVAHAGYVGDGVGGLKLHRQDLGLWLAVEATRDEGSWEWVGEMPVISSVKGRKE